MFLCTNKALNLIFTAFFFGQATSFTQPMITIFKLCPALFGHKPEGWVEDEEDDDDE